MPDVTGKLPGRGLWLLADPAVIQMAVDKKLFFKASKKSYTKVPADLVAQVEKLVRAQVMSLLGLARKAGQAVGGFEHVKEALAAQKVSVVLEAPETSDNAKGKLYRPQDTHLICNAVSASELGGVFGFEEMMFAAVLNGAMADKIKPFIIKLNAFHAYKERIEHDR